MKNKNVSVAHRQKENESHIEMQQTARNASQRAFLVQSGGSANPRGGEQTSEGEGE